MDVQTHGNMAPGLVPGVQPVTGTTVFFENPGAVGAYLDMYGAVVYFVVPGVTDDIVVVLWGPTAVRAWLTEMVSRLESGASNGKLLNVKHSSSGNFNVQYMKQKPRRESAQYARQRKLHESVQNLKHASSGNLHNLKQKLRKSAQSLKQWNLLRKRRESGQSAEQRKLHESVESLRHASSGNLHNLMQWLRDSAQNVKQTPRRESKSCAKWTCSCSGVTLPASRQFSPHSYPPAEARA